MARAKQKGKDPTARALDKRECSLPGCGRRFTPDTSSRYYCSTDCAAKALKRRLG